MERAGKGEGRERARRGKEGEGEVCVIAVGGIDPLRMRRPRCVHSGWIGPE